MGLNPDYLLKPLLLYYELCLSIIWQTVGGVQYKYAFDVRYSQCGRTVSEGANFFMYRGSPDSTDFGAKGNRTIAKTELIEGWFITKTVKWGKSNFKVHFLTKFFFQIIIYCTVKSIFEIIFDNLINFD